MDTPRTIFGVPIVYIGIAFVVGIIFAFGYSTLAYRPQPVQVPVNQYSPLVKYTPAPAPQPAITAVPAPTGTGQFDPAPPPVVITTAPPEPTPVAPSTQVNQTSSQWCTVANDLNSTMTAIAVIPILFGVLMIVGAVTLIGVGGSSDKTNDSNRSTLDDHGIPAVELLASFILFAILLFFVPVLLSAISNSFSVGMCP